jgi:diguanylate cyclase (GGDEF)-like protein
LRSFKNRILILIVALVTLAQGVTLLLILGVVRDSVRAQSELDLSAARAVLTERLNERWRERRENAEALLSRNFTFLEVLGTGDAPTIASALDNLAGARLGASFSLLFDADGKLIAGDTKRVAGGQLVLPEEGGEQPVQYVAIGQQPYQIVYAELKAPQLVGWVALGFALDDSLAQQLQKLAIANVRFVTLAPGSIPATGVVQNDELLRLTTVLRHSNGNVALVVERSLESAMSGYRVMWLKLTGIVALILLLAAAAGFFTGRTFVQPLALLVAAAQRIARGDYGWTVQTRGGEEFQAVATTFNVMQDGIRERERLLYEQATRDALTGLPNRAGLQHWLAERIMSEAPLSLVKCDVHRFRDVNASMGNGAGDRVLCLLARRLEQLAAEPAGCARIGADQFVVAMTMPEADAEQRLRALAADLRSGVAVDGVVLSIELRSGVAMLHPGVTADDLQRQAGVALNEAKEQRQECVLFRAAYDVGHQRRIMLVADLRRAISNGSLTLAWQPLVQISNREARLMEVLVRWTHPSLGEISPAEFVPLAERASLVSELSRWVLKAAIEQLGRWRRNGLALEAAVNLSATDMTDAGLVMRTLTLLQDNAVPAELLLLEVTESAIMEEPVQAARLMGQLRAAGVRFAIDDFGTGHSSLAQLRALPVDEIKIDRSFVHELDGNTANQAIVRSTIELGHILGLKVVAEGIETPQVWDLLRQMGCDLAQGYFISRPMMTSLVPEWLATHRARLSAALEEAERSGQLTALRPRRA